MVREMKLGIERRNAKRNGEGLEKAMLIERKRNGKTETERERERERATVRGRVEKET